MKTISKKDIRAKLEKSMHDTLTQFDISKPTRKTEKFIKKTTKKLSGKIKQEVKRQAALTEKKDSKVKRKNVSKTKPVLN